ncbi:MAG TPA: class I SAM-dependent methyltransferase, partial [Myxococcaceae bacterium]|nr:class I SAM-dependent methyltransferase [Myxococcaceae bacterium]
MGFETLPWKERLFVAVRRSSAPLAEVAQRVTGRRVVDVGCGHGALTSLLAEDPGRRVLGVDPDPRKIQWARRALGSRTNVELRACTVQDLSPELDGALDAVVIADVLYLVPIAERAGVLRACRRLLAPWGALVLKEAEADRSWRYWKALLQENLVVRLLQRTQSSGGLAFQSRASWVRTV